MIKLVLEGKEKISARLWRWIRRSPGIASNSMYDACEEILIPAIRGKLIETDAIFTRELYDSIEATIKSQSPPTVEVGSTLPYAQIIEQGGNPREEDIDKLTAWVEFRTGYTGEEAVRVALAVQQTIRNQGTSAQPFIMPAFEETREALAQRASVKIGAGIKNTP